MRRIDLRLEEGGQRGKEVVLAVLKERHLPEETSIKEQERLGAEMSRELI